MSIIRIDFHPSLRQLAVFGVAWLVFFALFGSMVHYRGGSWTAVMIVWTVGAAVPAVGWLSPAFMRIVYVGMACAAYPVGLVLGQAALAAVYYLVLAPTGLVLRALGYDPMDRRFDGQAETYWTPRSLEERVSRYFRQF